MVSYFYALKASKKLLDAKKTETILNIGCVILVIILAVVLLAQYIQISNQR